MDRNQITKSIYSQQSRRQSVPAVQDKRKNSTFNELELSQKQFELIAKKISSVYPFNNNNDRSKSSENHNSSNIITLHPLQKRTNTPTIITSNLNYNSSSSSFSTKNHNKRRTKNLQETTLPINNLITSREQENDSIRWSNQVARKVWKKLREVKEKMRHKKQYDYETIVEAICKNEDELVIDVLKSEKFKMIYRQKDNLFPKDVFLDVMVRNLKFDLLMNVTEDEYYELDKDEIFRFILYLIHPLKNSFKSDDFDDKSSSSINDSASNSGSSKHMIKVPEKTNVNINNKFLKDKENIYIYLNKPSEDLKELSENHIQKIIERLVAYKLYDGNNPEKIKIISWCLAMLGYFDSFLILIKDNKNIFEEELFQFDNFEKATDIEQYFTNKDCYINTVSACLKCHFEEMAIILADLSITDVDLFPLYETAAHYEDMLFLKYLWEMKRKAKNLGLNHFSRTQPKKSIFTGFFHVNMSGYMSNFNLSETIKILANKERHKTHTMKKTDNIRKIFTWKNIEKDQNLIDALFKNECFSHICMLLKFWPNEQPIKPEYFKESIIRREKELLIFFLKKPECKVVLTENDMQNYIINEYISKGDCIYYGAEMLNHIYKNSWNSNSTKNLCKNITKTLKTKDILNCHSPILTCLLLIEFLKRIKTISMADLTRCEKLITQLLEFCQDIEESYHDENYIAYLMKQKDTRDRTAFQIISENSFYQLLESPEVGTTVKKMWDGTKNTNGFLSASSMHRFLFNKDNKLNPFYSFDPFDGTKLYFFQVPVWLNSCNLRIKPNLFFTILLVICYTSFIFFLNDYEEVLNTYEQMSRTSKDIYLIYLLMTHFLLFQRILEITFLFLTNREIQIETAFIFDVVLYIFSWLIKVDIKKFVGDYDINELENGAKNLVWYISIPFLKEVKTEEPSINTSLSHWLRLGILAINDILVWSKLTLIFLTDRSMGPVIRMIFSMGKLLIKYILIIVLFMACCAGVFTCLFNRHSSQFFDFSTSIITLLGSFLNTFDCNNFDDDYRVFGSIILLIYVCISSVLFINLLIAILSSVFDEMVLVVEASHRAVLINYYKKYRWDENYGYITFLYPPFNLLVLPILLINLSSSNQKNFNRIVTNIFYAIFYFPFILIFFFIYTLILIFFAYIKGIMIMIRYLNSVKILNIYKFFYFTAWILSGIFFLIFIHMRDVTLMMYYIFSEGEQRGDEYERLRKNLSQQDVVRFLKFIHSKEAMESSSDVHSMFLAYLDYEKREKAIDEEHLKYLIKYTDELGKDNKNNFFQNNFINKQQAKISTSFMNQSSEDSSRNFLPKNSIKGERSPTNKVGDIVVGISKGTSDIRKNLMVIEILQNFLIENENDKISSSSVNVEKMRKILPLVMNVENHHFRRLIHNNSQNLLNAMSKINSDKLSFVQYLLVNRIMTSARKIDKTIDIEVSKLMKDLNENEKRKKIKRKADKENKKETEVKEYENELKSMRTFYAIIKRVRDDTLNIIKEAKYFGKSSMGSGSFIGSNVKQSTVNLHAGLRSSLKANIPKDFRNIINQ